MDLYKLMVSGVESSQDLEKDLALGEKTHKTAGCRTPLKGCLS